MSEDRNAIRGVREIKEKCLEQSYRVEDLESRVLSQMMPRPNMIPIPRLFPQNGHLKYMRGNYRLILVSENGQREKERKTVKQHFGDKITAPV